MQLKITLCNPQNQKDEYDLFFNLDDNILVKKWARKLVTAQKQYSIDDRKRFYGFNSFEEEVVKATNYINECITIINNDKPIIDRKFDSIYDTDTLNYLHHIFEIYHGLLDKQDHDFWNNAKTETKIALANLNIAVHRVENVIYGNNKRFTITYFGLPKTDFLTKNDYSFFTREYKFGDIFINYVEIGKTIEDLWRDKDEYIEPEAFQPFCRFSADFTVKFYDEDINTVKNIMESCSKYFNEKKKFFNSLGYKKLEKKLLPGLPKIGSLVYNNKLEVIKNIESRQMIKLVILLP